MKTTIVLLLFGLFSPAFGWPAPSNLNRFGEDDDCDVNEYDGAQKCHCGEGRKISWVTAEYDSGKNDRKYEFKCTDIPGNTGGWSGDTWYFFDSHVTNLDQALFKFEYMFESGNGKYRHNGVEISKPTDKSNYFLIGIESTHDNGKEDRKFQVFYAMSTKYRLEGCTWLIQSQYYETIQFPSSGLQTTWGGEKVFRGLESRHNVDDATGEDGDGDDRIWKFQYCNLVSKCGVLVSMEYGTAVAVESGDTTVNSKIINNLDMSYAVTSTIEITEANTESISESYSFGGSESSEVGASLEISQTASYGVPTVGEGETSVTASVNSLFTWESNWDRSSSQEYSTEHSTTMSWEITCPSRCLCERSIKVEKKKYEVPYTMVASSEGGTETCTETGKVTYDVASEAELTGGDYTSLEKTERCENHDAQADDINIFLTLKKID